MRCIICDKEATVFNEKRQEFRCNECDSEIKVLVSNKKAEDWIRERLTDDT